MPFSSRFPGHASLVLHLIQQEDADDSFVSAMLSAAQPVVLEWLRDPDAAPCPGFAGLTLVLIERSLIEPSEAVSVAKLHYPRLMEGEYPPLQLPSIAWVCLTLRGHKKEAKLPHPDALLCVLHMLLAGEEYLSLSLLL